MNEQEIFFHANNNSRTQIVQHDFTARKYNVKLNIEAASGTNCS